ncbi:MAG: phosphoesterase [Desulfuromonas sp.]|nr:MAG: phosphoesterase [Desulfuromonas sp.]
MTIDAQGNGSQPGCPTSRTGTDNVGDLIEWLRGRGKVLIVTHDNPDPDSLASAVALRHLILMKTGQDAVLTYGGVIGRGENRKMVDLLEIRLVPIGSLDLDQFAVICMVDTQPAAGNNSLPPDYEVDLVIDHHMPKSDLSHICWVDIREHYGASATILYEYLTQQEVSINTRLATSLFYAIKSETQDLGREWSKADREAYLKLLPLSNNRILFEVIHPQVPCNYFLAFNTALKKSTIYDDILVFNLGVIENPDYVSELADFLLRYEGVRYVLGMGHYEGTQILSMRSLNSDARLGALIQKMVKGVGTAGGHGMIAGGQVRNIGGDGTSQCELEKLLTLRMFEEMGREPIPGRPLLVDEGIPAN